MRVTELIRLATRLGVDYSAILLVPFGGLTIIELRLSPQFGPQIAWMSMDEK